MLSTLSHTSLMRPLICGAMRWAPMIATAARPILRRTLPRSTPPAPPRTSFSTATATTATTATTASPTTTDWKASWRAMATQPINAPKPVKEVKGVEIDNVHLGAEFGDGALGRIQMEPAGTGAPFHETLVGDVLKRKEKFGTALHTVKASDSVLRAMQMMNLLNIGAVLVTDDKDSTKIVGILSTRDFIKAVADDGADPRHSKVQDMMVRQPVFAYSDTLALHSLTLMQNGGFRHLPVRDRATNRTIGLVSVGDMVRTLLETFKEKTEFLEEMISGKYPA